VSEYISGDIDEAYEDGSLSNVEGGE
jgi:hypothetical protein